MPDNPDRRADKTRLHWGAGIAMTFLCGVYFWLHATQYLSLNLAWSGFSAMDWLYVASDPVRSAINFPNGTGNYDKSFFMLLYPLGLKLGFPVESLIPVVVALEMILMSGAMFYLAQTLFPRVSPLLYAAVTIVALWTSSRDMDLARFGQPFFSGLYYNAADAARLAALAAFLNRRVVLSGFLLAVCYACHPTMGLMGAAFLGAAYLADYRAYPIRKIMAAIAAFIIPSFAWTALTLGDAHLSSGGIPTELWLQLTHIFNFHWYPFESGVFTVLHELHFLPFVAFLVLLLYSLSRLTPLSGAHRQVVVAMTAMIPLVALGIVFSKFLPIPVLVKLSLHRANDMIISVGMIFVIYTLWQDILEGRVWAKATAVLVLFATFLTPRVPVFPVALVFLFTFPAWMGIADRARRSWNLAVCGASVLLLALAAYYYFSPYTKPLTSVSYSGWDGLRSLFQHAWWLALAPLFLLTPGLHARHRAALTAILLVAFSAFATTQRFPDRGDITHTKEQLYLEAQLWARDHTPEDALFISDPAIYYGWRDFSHRALFGNLRDWLHGAWLYSSDRKLFEEGLRRFNEFGVDLTPYLTASNISWGNHGELTQAVRKAYYAMNEEQRAALAAKYNIDYFVFDKAHGTSENVDRVVYENERFQIVHYARGPEPSSL